VGDSPEGWACAAPGDLFFSRCFGYSEIPGAVLTEEAGAAPLWREGKMEKELWAFLEKTQEMRRKQAEYFRTHDANVLQESKKLEREVDGMADELQSRRKGEMLF